MLGMKVLSHLDRYSLLILCQHCITSGFLICTLTREQAWQGRPPLHVRLFVSISSQKTAMFTFHQSIWYGSQHTSFFHPQHGNPGATKESYYNVHAQQYPDLAHITTFAKSGNPEHDVHVIKKRGSILVHCSRCGFRN